MDADYIGIPVEAGHHFSLVIELLRPGSEGLLGFLIGDRYYRSPGIPDSQSHGIVFLHRKAGIQLQIISKISDPESALSYDSSDHVPLVQHTSYRKSYRILSVRHLCKSAVRTGYDGRLRKAVFTEFSVV